MKLIALEEHFVTREVYDAMTNLPATRNDPSVDHYSVGETLRKLEDLGDQRLRDMDDCGVDVQVISLLPPGLQIVDPSLAPGLARCINDLTALTVQGRPDRFEGLATLPTYDPGAAAEELERAVSELGLLGAMINGRTGNFNLDDPIFEIVFARAAALHCPIYIHPQVPAPAIRALYYSGFGDDFDAAFASGGVGWHYETGMQVLRLILSGIFDRHPDLQVIVGHWGEVVLFYLDRIAALDKAGAPAKSPLIEYFRKNIFITPSGIFSQRYLRWAIEVVGVERIMFSTDYPFQMAPGGGARDFLLKSSLSSAAQERIASGNWLELTNTLRRKVR